MTHRFNTASRLIPEHRAPSPAGAAPLEGRRGVRVERSSVIQRLYRDAKNGQQGSGELLVRVLVHALKTSIRLDDRHVVADLLSNALSAKPEEMRRVLGLQTKHRPSKKAFKEAVHRAIEDQLSAGVLKSKAIAAVAKAAGLEKRTVVNYFNLIERGFDDELRDISEHLSTE